MNQQHNLAFVFPGQGSQSIGMLDDLAQHYPEVKQTFEQASAALNKDLWALVTESALEAELNQTHNTQPAMLAAGVAVWRVWTQHSRIRPAWLAGHSLGEYSALVCAGVLDFEEAIKLVALRGTLMQEAVPQGVGAMAAILGLDDDVVVDVCAHAAGNEIVSAVNFNSQGQVVIAGHAAAVERAMAGAKDAGAKRAVRLPVSVPSHCALMQPAAEKLAHALDNLTLHAPNATLIHNVDVLAHQTPEAIRFALKEQLYKPVRWVDTIGHMAHHGVSHFVECGPGKVLIGLNKRIAKEATHCSLYDAQTLNTLMEQL
ncbi:MAG TPA: [acyl-carrier-protein] S-malonyltransferase [Methylococcaceae bacterium]|nr:[acyl-carrier-protein] S-malonyltransferase [Methylococcaceae bacterium]